MEFTGKLLTASTIFVAGFLAACILLYFAILETDFAWLQNFREWIGALSGWIAAGGALAVGIPTIKTLRQQLRVPIVQAEIAKLEMKVDTLIEAMRTLDNLDDDPKFFSSLSFYSPSDQIALMQSRYIAAIKSINESIPATKRFYPLGEAHVWRTHIRNHLSDLQKEVAEGKPFDMEKMLEVNRYCYSSVYTPLHGETVSLQSQLTTYQTEIAGILKDKH